MHADLEKHELLKFRLRQRQLSFAQIARALGITPGSVTAVSQGHRRSQRVERALAEALGTTPEALFPERSYGRKKQ
ncbi:helix-turn-helix domain-containing protein [Aliiroseovarius sp. Z3]|uniref:helix-turn-helix domain-containing protein n=1 Tax=Aliiroseovarius TaxID=1658781 RepID=UPI001749FAE1|nr:MULTISPECIES: helix-turn-helix domain-containing protein [Aliiroseovarius]MDE9451518.1 helix-turn-helix domain-containing protein [Aliiroseovarius sp. Z3]